MTATKNRKNQRCFTVRATAYQKQLIARVAERENTSFNDFVLNSALSVAQTIVSSDANLDLDMDQWQVIRAALGAPPRNAPALRKLLTESGIFDDE